MVCKFVQGQACSCQGDLSEASVSSDTERVQQRLLFTNSVSAFLLLSSEHPPWEYAEYSNMAFGSNDIESQFLHRTKFIYFHQSRQSSPLTGHSTAHSSETLKVALAMTHNEVALKKEQGSSRQTFKVILQLTF